MRDFRNLEVSTLISRLATELDKETKDVYLVFVGFSTRGSLLDPNDTMKSLTTKQLDMQYKPKLFLFEKTEEDHEILANPNKEEIMLTFGITILDKEKKKSWMGSLYGGNSVNEEHPTFVKPFFALKNSTVSYLYKRIFEKLVHFTSILEEFSMNEGTPVDYNNLFEKYMFNEKSDYKDLLFHIKIDDKVYMPNDKTKLSDLFTKNTWNGDKNEFSYTIMFTEKDPKKPQIDFEQMKTCTGHSSDIKIKSSEDLEKNKSVPLESLFEKFKEKEQLDADNKWYCPTCKDHVQATISMDIYKAPEFLIVQMKKLKGFATQRGQNGPEATPCKSVHFPVEGLDLSPFVINHETLSDYNITPEEYADKGNTKIFNKMTEESKFDATKPMLYDLYGVVNHYGSYHGGHYTAYCKNVDGNWYEYNDSSVSPISNPKSVVTDAAYVLFYRRRKN